MGHPGRTRPLGAAARHGVGRNNQLGLLPQRHSRGARAMVDQIAWPSDTESITFRELLDRIGPPPSDLIGWPKFATEIAGAIADLRGSINAETLPEMALRLALHRLGHERHTVFNAVAR